VKAPAAGANVLTRYYSLNGTTIGLRPRTGTVDGALKLVVGNRQGSASATIDAGVVSINRYLPYGGLRGVDAIGSTDRGFLGQIEDTSTGLNYLNARYQDPSLGRFVSVDPLVDASGEAYGYAGNNPISRNDPSGLSWWNDFLSTGKGLVGGLSDMGSGVVSLVNPNTYVEAFRAVEQGAYEDGWTGGLDEFNKHVNPLYTTGASFQNGWQALMNNDPEHAARALLPPTVAVVTGAKSFADGFGGTSPGVGIVYDPVLTPVAADAVVAGGGSAGAVSAARTAGGRIIVGASGDVPLSQIPAGWRFRLMFENAKLAARGQKLPGFAGQCAEVSCAIQARALGEPLDGIATVRGPGSSTPGKGMATCAGCDSLGFPGQPKTSSPKSKAS
jgi:RHS repeat-associated protein